MSDEQPPKWFLWIYERGLLFWQALLGVVAIVLVVVALLIHARLQEIENSLAYPGGTPGGHIETVELPEYIAKGQTVYAPLYSHVYHRQGEPLKLTATLSIRNTDSDASIVVTSVDYYNTQGELVQKYLSGPQRLAPLASMEHLVKEEDISGGFGAKFLVAWVAEENVHEPLIQTVMIGTSGNQGISFIAEGVVLESKTD